MIKNDNFYSKCQDLCRNNNYPLVILKLNNTDDDSSYITISEIIDNIYNSIISLSRYESLLNYTLCINNTENNK